MTPGREKEVWRTKDGRAWRVGLGAETAWIRENTEPGLGAETIFYDVPKVTLYSDWHDVLIEAGREQAGRWRTYDLWKGVLPDLMFPTDRSWLLSTLWDDHWTCIVGSKELVDAFLAHPDLRHRVHEVDPSVEAATPLGHIAI